MDHAVREDVQVANAFAVLARAAGILSGSDAAHALASLLRLLAEFSGATQTILIARAGDNTLSACVLPLENGAIGLLPLDSRIHTALEGVPLHDQVLSGLPWHDATAGKANGPRRWCAPLRHGGHVLGAVLLEGVDIHSAGPATVRAVESLCDLAAVGLAQHRLNAPAPAAGCDTESRPPDQAVSGVAPTARFLTEVIDAIPQPVYVKDERHRWVLVNAALCEWFGRTREEMLGHTDLDYLPESIARGSMAEDDRAFRTGESVLSEVRYGIDAHRPVSWLKSKRAFAMPDGTRFVVGINTDMSAQDSARRALASSERFLSELIDAIPQIIVVKDAAQRWVMVNKATCEWYGRARSELIGRTDADLHPPEVAARYVDEDGRAALAGRPLFFEEQRVDNAGDTHWFMKIKYGFTLPDGASYRLAISADVTDNKRYQLAVEKQWRFFESVIDAIPQPVYVKDHLRRYALANEAFCRLIGRTRDRLLGRTDEQIGNLVRARVNRQEDERVLLTGEPEAVEERLTIIDEGPRWFLRAKARVPELNGNPSIVCVKTDISDVKEAERAARRLSDELEQSRAYLDTVINAIPYPIFVKDESLRWTLVNDAFSKLVGIPVSELLGKTDEDVHGSDYARERFAEDRHVLSGTPGESLVFTGRFERETGRTIWFLRSKTLVSLPDGRREIVGIATDVTDLKMTELALRESEARFRGTFEQAAVGICHSTTDGRFMRINARFCELLGYSINEVLAKTFVEITHPDDVDADLANVRALLAREIETYSMEKRYVRKDGGVIWVNLTVSLALDNDGAPSYFIGVVEEITRRKQDEARLLRSETTLASAQRMAHVGSWHWNLETDSAEWSAEMYRILGIDPETTAPSYERFLECVHPSDRGRLKGRLEHTILSGGDTRTELRVIRPTGEQRNLYATVETERSGAGAVRTVLGTLQDITERKRSEELLRRSEATLAASQRMAHLGSWRWHVPRNLMVWSEETFNIFGVDPVAFPVTFDRFMACIHEEDRARVESLIRAAPDDRRPAEYEFRVCRPSGEERLVSAVHEVIENDDGSVDEVLGSVHDVTARRVAEARVQAALHEKEILLKEIYHRVKNNLQVISSLLQMQARSVDSEAFSAAIEDSVRRVKSMALVHEQLYRSEDLARVDFGEYMHTLVEQLSYSYHAGERGIRVVADILEAPMGIETAIPCGLIVSELVSNAFKHAFTGRSGGTVMIRFCAGPGDRAWILTVGDDGIGFPEDLDIGQNRSLGLRLVTTLTEQISGTLEITREPGTVFTITFLDEEKSK